MGRSSFTSGKLRESAIGTLSTGWAAGMAGKGGSGGRVAPTVSVADVRDASRAVAVRRMGMRRMERERSG